MVTFRYSQVQLLDESILVGSYMFNAYSVQSRYSELSHLSLPMIVRY